MKQWLSKFAVGLWVVSVSLGAHAAPKDDEAKALAQEAVFTDYLNLELDQAQAKLNQALDLCQQEACSPAVIAGIYRDLAVVTLVGRQELEEGKGLLVQALLIDPTVTLDPDLSSPELDLAFQEAKGLAGVALDQSGGEPATEPSPTPPPATSREEQLFESTPEGQGIEHVPPSEQAIHTPVPIFVKVQTPADSVTIEYKPFGFSEWKSLRLKAYRDGHSIDVPCLDIGSTTGKLKYFISARDKSGKIVASSGTRDVPHEVPIRRELLGEPPHLPGKPPPAQCVAAVDCPPGFPGCDDGEDDFSLDDDDEKTKAAPEEAKHWLTFAFQQEFVNLSTTDTACAAESDYTCFYAGGEFIGVGGAAPHSNVGRLEGGFAPGTGRLLVGYDYAGLGPIRLGARAGFAFRGGPQEGPDGTAFVPFHFEGRVSWWPIQRSKGLLPYVLVGAGIAQVDAALNLTIPTGNAATPLCSTGLDECSVDAWRRLGTSFAELGAGALLALSDNSGPFLELKYMAMFGVAGNVLAGQFGYAVGF